MTSISQSSAQFSSASKDGGTGQRLDLPRSHPLYLALNRAASLNQSAQHLCVEVGKQASADVDVEAVQAMLSGLELQIGLVGHLLDCAFLMIGDPVATMKGSLAEWLAVGDIEAAIPAARSVASL
jgi:hypothetical protein